MEEDGGANLCAFCHNDGLSSFDIRGTDFWIEQTEAAVRLHRRICVTAWKEDVQGKYCCEGKRYRRFGRYCISFGRSDRVGTTGQDRESYSCGEDDNDPTFPPKFGSPNPKGDGEIYEDNDSNVITILDYQHDDYNVCFDLKAREYMEGLIGKKANYSLLWRNCRHFSRAMYDQIMEDWTEWAK